MMTSVTHPLRIETVSPQGTDGLIGMTLCPGRKGPATGGVWDRDLDLDLEVVRAWKPDIAISLLEAHEYALHGVADFRSRVRDAGLPWEFAPMPDGGLPGEPFTRAWEALRPRVHRILRDGGRVLVHCKAGLGRTGMLAALLLVDFCEAPESAIARVRAARPQTIEDRQEAFVLRYRPAFGDAASG